MSEPVDVILWVAWMARWGEPFPTNAYSVGVFNCPEAAQEAGRKESQYRGLKYEFQHSPCHVDMLDLGPDREIVEPPPPPGQVLLCSTTHPGVGRYANRHHLVGLFSTEARAMEVAGILYPGWKAKLSWEEVTVIPPDPRSLDEIMSDLRNTLQEGS